MYAETSEFLNLPMSACTRHPLRFSIAHDTHGRQMRTSFPTEPTSLADRRPEQRNMLVETWFTNELKSDYPPDQYPALRDLVKAVNIPLHIFDPTAAAPTASSASQSLPLTFTPGDIQELAQVPDVSLPGVNEDELFDLINGEDTLVGAGDQDETGDQDDSEDEDDTADQANAAAGADAPSPPQRLRAHTLQGLKEQCKSARELAKSLGVDTHITVYRLTASIFDGTVADNIDKAALQQIAKDCDELTEYVENISRQLDDEDKGHGDERFDVFHTAVTGFLSSSNLSGPWELAQFLDIINSGVSGDVEFGGDEALDFVRLLQNEGILSFNEATHMVDRA